MIPEAALKLMTFRGFNDKVNELKPYYDTRREAYEATEREYESFFGVSKYSSYNSFLSMQYKNSKK